MALAPVASSSVSTGLVTGARLVTLGYVGLGALGLYGAYRLYKYVTRKDIEVEVHAKDMDTVKADMTSEKVTTITPENEKLITETIQIRLDAAVNTAVEKIDKAADDGVAKVNAATEAATKRIADATAKAVSDACAQAVLASRSKESGTKVTKATTPAPPQTSAKGSTTKTA
jgi:hypothetical protein